MCVSKIPAETDKLMQPSSSTPLQPSSVLKIKMMQPSSRPYFSFVIITSYGNQITPVKHGGNLEIEVLNPDASQEDCAGYTSDTKGKPFAALSSRRQC